MAATERRAATQLAEALYEQHVRPLEREHAGEYAAVSRDGKFVLAPTPLDVMAAAEQSLEPGSFVFKVGDFAVDMWR